MRICFLILSVFLIGVFNSCDKDSVSPNNYLKADINGQEFIAYEKSELNTDTVPNASYFSFGKSITGKDTCIVLTVSLNRECIHISFPKTSEPKVFAMYRGSNDNKQPSAHYMEVKESIDESGLEVYYTRNMLKDESIQKLPIGEVDVRRIDMKNRMVEGTFNFTAFCYEQSAGIIIPIDKTISISNGKFYYHWDENLAL